MDLKFLENLLGDIVNIAGVVAHSDEAKEYFNIFKVLGVETKEVILCRLLRELLDPSGSHNMGSEGLYRFVKDTLGVSDFSKSDSLHSKVVAEEWIDNNRRVDIVIHTPRGVIPIEVKIWAEDQGAQLSDYYHYYKKQNKKLLTGKIHYLTPTGWNPSEKSRGNLNVEKEIGLLSFRKDIKTWLESYPHDPTNMRINLCINQFVEVIDIMSKDVEEMDVLTECLCGEGAWNIKKSNAALLLLKHGQQIHKEILKNYLKKEVKFDESITIMDCTDADQVVDSHALVRIIQNGKAVACICVDTNLYLFCKKQDDEKNPDGWVDYEDGQHRWKYICPKDYTKNRYPLRNIVELKPITVELEDILKDITMAL